MSESVQVLSLPDCEIPLCSEIARYDAKMTRGGLWANMCEPHFKNLGLGLGTGKGQRLILSDEAELKLTMDKSEKEISNLRSANKMHAQVTFLFDLEVGYDEAALKKGIEAQLKKFTPKSDQTKVLSATSSYQIIPDPEPEAPAEDTKKGKKGKKGKAEAAPAPVEAEEELEPGEDDIEENQDESEEDADL